MRKHFLFWVKKAHSLLTISNAKATQLTDAIDKTVFYVNGERIPQYDMKNPQVYNQSLIVLVSATMFQVVSTMTSIHTNRGKKITGLLLPDYHTYVIKTLLHLALTLTVFL